MKCPQPVVVFLISTSCMNLLSDQRLEFENALCPSKFLEDICTKKGHIAVSLSLSAA